MIITLLTDFGQRDWFVPSMKGVILGIAPRARIVDLTHDIPSQDVRAGAFVLAATAPAFPKGTIHVAVIDPGVGSARRAIAVKTSRHVFIGPDNGLLSLAARQEKSVEIRVLENERFFRHPVSHTFHGRDIFAPVAAHLARGVKFAELGQRLKSMQTLHATKPTTTANGLRGEVIYIDHFGNLITNLPAKSLSRDITIRLGRYRVRGLSDCYSQVKPGKLVAVVNSIDLIEIGLRDGDASRKLRLRIGAPVSIDRLASH